MSPFLLCYVQSATWYPEPKQEKKKRKTAKERLWICCTASFSLSFASRWRKDAVSEPQSAHVFLGANICSPTRLTSSCVEQDERLFHSSALCFFCIFQTEKESPHSAGDMCQSSDVSINAELSCYLINLVVGKLLDWCATMAGVLDRVLFCDPPHRKKKYVMRCV